MIFGGFVKQSLIDYPGKVAAVLFTQACNFCCGYCHNPQLVLPELFTPSDDCSEEAVLQYIYSRRNWLDGVVVTGGEPCMQPDLPQFLAKLRSWGLSIKLDTNGSRPQLLQQLIDNSLVDYVAMDIKTLPVADYHTVIGRSLSVAQQSDILSSICLLQKASVEVEFRTTLIPGIHNQQTIDLLHESFKDYRYTTAQFREGNTVKDFLVKK